MRIDWHCASSAVSRCLIRAAGKVLIPTSHFIRTLVAARLAADVCDVRLYLHAFLVCCSAPPCSGPACTQQAVRHCSSCNPLCQCS